MDGKAWPAVRAVSQDGRTFEVLASAPTPLLAGDVVVLDVQGGNRYLGQVLSTATEVGGVRSPGVGRLVGQLSPGGAGVAARAPFADASLQPATAADLEQWQHAHQAFLPIGTWTSCGVQVPARLRAQGFARHTFLCGQSGSGKTYALGVILEQILLGTALRMVVLDPNADFIGLGKARRDAPVEATHRLGASDVRVLGAHAGAEQDLRMRFRTMPRQAQAAVLRLDPLVDRGEYNQFLHLMAEAGPSDVFEVVEQLHQGGTDALSLAQRIENLGLPEWQVWAGPLPSALEVVDDGARLTVLDLSGYATPDEPLAVSLDLIEGLWLRRERRTPTLIVVDEAHNLCPADPVGPLQTALVQRLVQIAAEGRKYGLWLLLSTQRPSKIHPQVLSQCDNLVLMRMNSPADIAELTESFGFAPPALLRASAFFAQGEALVAGGFVPLPAVITMGSRLTVEGGRDVPVPVPVSV